MSRTHIRQEGDAHEILIGRAVPATLTGGFYAYVTSGDRDRYIGGPHATRLAAELEAHDWIVGELKRRALKLHAGEHPAIESDEQAIAILAGQAVRS